MARRGRGRFGGSRGELKMGVAGRVTEGPACARGRGGEEGPAGRMSASALPGLRGPPRPPRSRPRRTVMTIIRLSSLESGVSAATCASVPRSAPHAVDERRAGYANLSALPGRGRAGAGLWHTGGPAPARWRARRGDKRGATGAATEPTSHRRCSQRTAARKGGVVATARSAQKSVDCDGSVKAFFSHFFPTNHHSSRHICWRGFRSPVGSHPRSFGATSVRRRVRWLSSWW